MFDLAARELRLTLDHLAHASGGQCPVLVLRPATFGEWTLWRRPEAAREQRLRRAHRARLEACGISSEEFARAQEVLRLWADGLEGRAKAAPDEPPDEREEGSGWRQALALIERYWEAPVEVEPETLETTRHTFELVLGCVTRIDHVSSHGKPVIWDDSALAALGASKAGLLEQLLGAGDRAMILLYQLSDLVVAGLSVEEKKASPST